MAKPVEVVVNGTTFFVTPLNPFDQLEAFGDLQRELLPSLSQIISLKDLDSDSGEIPPEAIGKAINELSSRFDGKSLKKWVDRLITADTVVVELNGQDQKLKPEVREMAFKSFTEILELLVKVIVINFAEPLKDFMKRSGLDQLLTRAQSQLGGTATTSKES